MSLTHTQISAALEATPLFDRKTWQLSGSAWPLVEEQVTAIQQIGQACLEFYRAMELLYTRSWQGKNLLRNRELRAPWVAEYLDRGKPAHLVAHSRSRTLRNQTPVVIRPDLLQTEDGFALSEIDSVPGGIGLTAYLNGLYGGAAAGIVGGDNDTMVLGFYESLAALVPDKALPLIAILVSDEAATYRPEMEWVAARLQQHGYRVHCHHVNDLMPLGDSWCVDVDGNPEEVDVIYRFWELFDEANVPVMRPLMQAVEDGKLVVSPPMRHFQEEKLNLALFHHHLLEDFWRENLSRRSFKLLAMCIPKSWIIDPVQLPPNAVLDAPWIAGKPIHRWQQLGEASQKERNLILKISGFHESAWGARSVLLGSDASRSEWEAGIEEALAGSRANLHILQDYRKPMRLRHPVFREGNGSEHLMDGRLRLCPYYFVKGDSANLSGILATFCPADKKIIHGMRDAALLPCVLTEHPAEGLDGGTD